MCLCTGACVNVPVRLHSYIYKYMCVYLSVHPSVRLSLPLAVKRATVPKGNKTDSIIFSPTPSPLFSFSSSVSVFFPLHCKPSISLSSFLSPANKVIDLGEFHYFTISLMFHGFPLCVHSAGQRSRWEVTPQ